MQVTISRVGRSLGVQWVAVFGRRQAAWASDRHHLRPRPHLPEQNLPFKQGPQVSPAAQARDTKPAITFLGGSRRNPGHRRVGVGGQGKSLWLPRGSVYFSLPRYSSAITLFSQQSLGGLSLSHGIAWKRLSRHRPSLITSVSLRL